jgi:hypothetical protein
MPARLSAFTALGPARDNPGPRYYVRLVDRFEENVHTDARVENDVINLHVLADGNESPRSGGIFNRCFLEKRTGEDAGALAFQELRELLGYRFSVMATRMPSRGRGIGLRIHDVLHGKFERSPRLKNEVS